MAEFLPRLADLLRVPHPTSLGPGTPATDLRARIATACADLPRPAQAGLWLRFDFLDESHAVSQEDEGHPDRDFWHAIMHRREPDAFNSKYWWRRVGSHPVLAQLATEAAALGYRYTTPFDFVDLCEKVRDTGTPQEGLAKRVQELEWRLLFEHCLRA
jgi:hypothetical protein